MYFHLNAYYLHFLKNVKYHLGSQPTSFRDPFSKKQKINRKIKSKSKTSSETDSESGKIEKKIYGKVRKP